MAPWNCTAALPPHALPWSGVNGLSQPGAELELPKVPAAAASKNAFEMLRSFLPELHVVSIKKKCFDAISLEKGDTWSKWSFVSALLLSLRTHYRGQVLTDSLNQGLNWTCPRYPWQQNSMAAKQNRPHLLSELVYIRELRDQEVRRTSESVMPERARRTKSSLVLLKLV